MHKGYLVKYYTKDGRMSSVIFPEDMLHTPGGAAGLVDHVRRNNLQCQIYGVEYENDNPSNYVNRTESPLIFRCDADQLALALADLPKRDALNKEMWGEIHKRLAEARAAEETKPKADLKPCYVCKIYYNDNNPEEIVFWDDDLETDYIDFYRDRIEWEGNLSGYEIYRGEAEDIAEDTGSLSARKNTLVISEKNKFDEDTFVQHMRGLFQLQPPSAASELASSRLSDRYTFKNLDEMLAESTASDWPEFPDHVTPSILLSTSQSSATDIDEDKLDLVMHNLSMKFNETKRAYIDETKKIISDARETRCLDYADQALIEKSLKAFMAQELSKQDYTAVEINNMVHDVKNWYKYGVSINLGFGTDIPEAEHAEIKRSINEILNDMGTGCTLANSPPPPSMTADKGEAIGYDFNDIQSFSGVKSMIEVTAASEEGIKNPDIAFFQVHENIMRHWDQQPIQLQMSYGDHHGYYVIQDNEILIVNTSLPKEGTPEDAPTYAKVDDAAIEAFVEARRRIKMLEALTERSCGDVLGEMHDLATGPPLAKMAEGFLAGNRMSFEDITALVNMFLEQQITVEAVQQAYNDALTEVTCYRTAVDQVDDTNACGPVVVEVAKQVDGLAVSGKRLDMRQLVGTLDLVIIQVLDERAGPKPYYGPF